jgi:thiamine pyrophosphate-dependent acetolactate synthase large subunit-like protein
VASTACWTGTPLFRKRPHHAAGGYSEHSTGSTNGDAFVTSDVGQHQMFAAQYYKFDKPRRWINSGGSRDHGLWSALGDGCEARLSG